MGARGTTGAVLKVRVLRVRVLAPIALALAAPLAPLAPNLQAQKAPAGPIAPTLRSAIFAIRAIDNHAHVTRAVAGDTDYDALPFALLDPAPPGTETSPAPLRPDNAMFV